MSFFEEEELHYDDNPLLFEAPDEKTTNERSVQTPGNITATHSKNTNSNKLTEDASKSAQNENQVAAQQQPQKPNKKKETSQSRRKIAKKA
uniref:Uncharacterized protein n=1 Tax=Romanomermis culicivorax TaxID=13658 RepID=A0A915KMS8_ROMCU